MSSRAVPRARRAAALPVFMLLAGCELQTLALTEPEDVVVAEIILRAGAQQQKAFLHRTAGHPSDVPGADILVISEAADTLRFQAEAQTECLDIDDAGVLGSCYASYPFGRTIQPGERYTLRITLPGGGVMTGVTHVPGEFHMVTPIARECRLDADTLLDLVWTRAENAWVYVAETRLRGIRSALRARGIEIDGDPIRLLGLAVGGADTVLTFPAEFGLFDRGDPDIAEALQAMQSGLPPNVVAETAIAAADRNYVNWARGGNFNPSGPVRVPSIHGAGTGVFGSTVPVNFTIYTGENGTPACD